MDRISGTSLSKCLWNQCPSGRGMSVQVSVDWVSKCAWNPQAGDRLLGLHSNDLSLLVGLGCGWCQSVEYSRFQSV